MGFLLDSKKKKKKKKNSANKPALKRQKLEPKPQQHLQEHPKAVPVSCPKKKKNKKKKKKKKKKIQPEPETVVRPDFLDFLQMERNKLMEAIECSKRMQAKLDEEREIEKKATTQAEKITSRRRQLLLPTSSSCSSSLEVFDRKIMPLLKMYYRLDSLEDIDSQKLFDTYNEMFLSHSPVIQSIDADRCHKCNIELLEIVDDSVLLCPSCAETKTFIDASVSTLSYGDEIEYTSFSYKRMNHLSEYLNHFQAKETTPVPDSVMNRIMGHLFEQGHTDPSKLTFHQVKTAQKQLGLRKFYDVNMQIYCRLTGKTPIRLDPILEEKIRLMFIQIQAPFAKFCPVERKNFLSYPYCMYNFCKLLGHHELLQYFPLLKGKEKLALQQKIFKQICDEVGWDFNATI